jgi:predicted GNAT family N-acyltransferase
LATKQRYANLSLSLFLNQLRNNSKEVGSPPIYIKGQQTENEMRLQHGFDPLSHDTHTQYSSTMFQLQSAFALNLYRLKQQVLPVTVGKMN